MDLSDAITFWNRLRDVPLYEDTRGVNRIEIAFEGFEPGTDIEDVWHYLEDVCPEFVAGHAMEGRYR